MGFMKLCRPNLIAEALFPVPSLDILYVLHLESLQAGWVYAEDNGTERYTPLLFGILRGSVSSMKDMQAEPRAGENQS